MRRILPVVACAAVAAAGCSADPVTDPSNSIPFTACSTADCAGTLPSGAEFDIILPENWNGTLAIYSHGLDGPGAVPADSGDAAEPTPTATPQPTLKPPKGLRGGDKKDRGGRKAKPSAAPQPSPVAPPVEPRPGGPELAPLWGDGDRSIADTMLQAGYAIAGATPPDQGWVVSDQIAAAEELQAYFTETIGRPNRTYVWGESTGGLASARLAQLHPDWVSGALAMCAPLSGPLDSFNLALDVGYAIRELLAPDLQLVGYASEDQARRQREIAVRAVQDAAAGSLPEQGTVAFIAAITDLPNSTRTQSGSTWASQIAANVEAIRNLIEQTTLQRYAFEQRVGGNFSGNAGTDYALRIPDVRREQLEGIRVGLTDRLLVRLADGERVTPDPAAAEAAAQQGTLEGTLEVPTVTLHNAIDPVYIPQNVSAYRETLATGEDDEAAARLVDAFVLPPSVVGPSEPAAQGIGNCDFGSRTILGAMIQLNQWVRNEQYPGRDSATAAFKSPTVTLDYDPGPWPQMSATAPPSEGEPSQQSEAATVQRSQARR